MNKKFSTLVASLLLTSAFSVYSVDAKPMLATPTQVETRATAADVEEAVEIGATATLPKLHKHLDGIVLPNFTNNARIVFVGTLKDNATRANIYYVYSNAGDTKTLGTDNYAATDAPDFYWTLINGRLVANSTVEFSLSGLDEYVEIIPIVQDGKATEYFTIAKRDNDGNLQYVERDGSSTNLKWSTSKAQDYTTNIANAALFVSVETEYNDNYSATEINDELKKGFNLFISSLIDEDADVVGDEIFEDAVLEAVGTSTDDAEYYQIKKGDKYIVFDRTSHIASDKYSEEGQFALVDAADLDADINNQLSYFHIAKADNGSEDVMVTVNYRNSKTASKTLYRLYIANVAGTYGLTIANKKEDGVYANDWAHISLKGDNIVNPKELLTGQFYTIDYKGNADKDQQELDAYKENGRLAIRNTGASETLQADFVKASSLYSKAPEAQWAVSASFDGDEINGIILTNRENPTISFTLKELRRDEGKVGFRVADASVNAGIVTGDYILMTPVTNHDKHDGYAVLKANDLRNETYHLGQVRQTADGDVNVYWAENHAESHQIGATVEEEKASRWNLSLVEKGDPKLAGQLDSVLVVSELQEWNADKSRIDAKKDTLVILPYAFQNRSNNEFVQMNNQTNLHYYICDKEDEKGYQYGIDAIFALKYKADAEDGTHVYNYVALPDRHSTKKDGDKTVDVYDYTYTKDGKDGYVKVIDKNSTIKVGNKDEKGSPIAEKVFQENSTDRGTWRDMEMYANDANSLMFVAKVEAPEYRKLVSEANLDTIKIYRADNEAQVVYEKRDDKSVVDGKTLSFLNIDNETQFTDINPALYADTAYVNRGNNTCWQYLLGVNIEHKEGFYCAEHGFNVTPPCEHAVPVSYNEGRYLVNLIDTANAYAANKGIHNNPYINESEEGRQLAKLGFVHGFHVLTDSVDMTKADHLYLIKGTEEGDTIPVALNTPAFNNVKFAFKYVDYMENNEEFKIQTSYVPYVDDANGGAASEEGYLRWVNGCIVVDNGYTRGDIFNMDENETRTPTANETIEDATSAVSVIATEGGVIVKGAEGKNVIVSTILGKVVANEVINSDNETIAAPAGIVVVSVDGESFKVAVK